MRNPYQTRVVRQMILWVNGKNVHNTVDNECTPDFRCCVPDIPETPFDDRQAQLTKYIFRLNLRS